VGEPNYDQDMRLPDGKTCGDCVHIYRCTIFGFTSSPANTSCDFWPNRFRASALLGQEAAQPREGKEQESESAGTARGEQGK
jgi:hypothetical protein